MTEDRRQPDGRWEKAFEDVVLKVKQISQWLFIILLIGGVAACTRVGDPVTGEVQPVLPDVGEVDGGDGADDAAAEDDPCENAVLDPDETDVDCGGVCPNACAEGQGCIVGTDCQSGVCENDVCGPSGPVSYKIAYVSDDDGTGNPGDYSNIFFRGTDPDSEVRNLTENMVGKGKFDLDPIDIEKGLHYVGIAFNADGSRISFGERRTVFWAYLYYSAFDANQVGPLEPTLYEPEDGESSFDINGEWAPLASTTPSLLVTRTRYDKDEQDQTLSLSSVYLLAPFTNDPPIEVIAEGENHIISTYWNHTEDPNAAPEAKYLFVKFLLDGPLKIFIGDANQQKQIPFPSPHQEGSFESQPALSPDGTYLAYVVSNKEVPDIATPQIWFCEMSYADNTLDGIDCINHQAVTAGSSTNHAPCWTPDGQYLVYSSDSDGDYDIYMKNPLVPEEPVTNVTDSSAADRHPACYPVTGGA